MTTSSMIKICIQFHYFKCFRKVKLLFLVLAILHLCLLRLIHPSTNLLIMQTTATLLSYFFLSFLSFPSHWNLKNNVLLLLFCLFYLLILWSFHWLSFLFLFSEMFSFLFFSTLSVNFPILSVHSLIFWSVLFSFAFQICYPVSLFLLLCFPACLPINLFLYTVIST